MPLTKLTSASLENSRLRPAPGEIFENLGLRLSADQTRRCWIMLPATANKAISSTGIAIAAITSTPMRPVRRIRPAPSVRM